MSIYSTTNLPKRFYVYMYLREDGSPYYIGKGKGKRAWNRTKGHVKPNKDKTNIKIFLDDLEEQYALNLEVELITKYGRKSNNTGILRNLTGGGEGNSGHKHSMESRKKMSESAKGKTPSARTRKKLSEWAKGRKLSAEHRAKISKANKGRKHSPEICKKMSKIQMKPVSIQGQIHESQKAGAKAIGMSAITVDRRAHSTKWPDYFYINTSDP